MIIDFYNRGGGGSTGGTADFAYLAQESEILGGQTESPEAQDYDSASLNIAAASWSDSEPNESNDTRSLRKGGLRSVNGEKFLKIGNSETLISSGVVELWQPYLIADFGYGDSAIPNTLHIFWDRPGEEDPLILMFAANYYCEDFEWRVVDDVTLYDENNPFEMPIHGSDNLKYYFTWNSAGTYLSLWVEDSGGTAITGLFETYDIGLFGLYTMRGGSWKEAIPSLKTINGESIIGTGNITIASGPQGPEGPQGVEGPRGPQGVHGPHGADGPQGPQGPAGADGADGKDGADGAQGPQGPAGSGEQLPVECPDVQLLLDICDGKADVAVRLRDAAGNLLGNFSTTNDPYSIYFEGEYAGGLYQVEFEGEWSDENIHFIYDCDGTYESGAYNISKAFDKISIDLIYDKDTGEYNIEFNINYVGGEGSSAYKIELSISVPDDFTETDIANLNAFFAAVEEDPSIAEGAYVIADSTDIYRCSYLEYDGENHNATIMFDLNMASDTRQIELGFENGEYDNGSFISWTNNTLIPTYDLPADPMEGQIANYDDGNGNIGLYRYDGNDWVPYGGGEGGDNTILKATSGTPAGVQGGDVYAVSGASGNSVYQYNGSQGIELAKANEVVKSDDVVRIVKLTQAEYDALVSGGTVDENTLYLIVAAPTPPTPTAKTLVITNAPEGSAGMPNGSMSGGVQGGANLFDYSSIWNDIESSADTTVTMYDTAFTYTYSSNTLTITGPFSGAYDITAEVFDYTTCLSGSTGWLTADFSSADTVTLQISITPDYDQECLCTQQGGVWDGSTCTYPNPEPEPEPES